MRGQCSIAHPAALDPGWIQNRWKTDATVGRGFFPSRRCWNLKAWIRNVGVQIWKHGAERMSLLHGARQTPAVQFARLQRHHRMKTRSRSAARWHPNPLARVARSIYRRMPTFANRGGGNPPPALLGQATWGSGPRLRAATLATEHWASIGSCRDVSAPTAQLHDRANPLPDHSSTPARRSPTSLRNRPACDASAQGVDQVCTTALAIWSKGRRGPCRRRNTRQVAGFHARRASKARAFEGNPGGIELR